MTAYSSAIPEATAAEQLAHEPSMEEILASIRKIISEDQTAPAPTTAPAQPTVTLKPDPRVVRDEDRPPSAREPEVERLRSSAGRPSAEFGAPPSPPRGEQRRPVIERPADLREPGARPPVSAPRLVTMKDEAPLLSEQTNSAVSSAFQALGAAWAVPSPQAMDAMAREMLRPLLKEWLDSNLPSLVERLVRAEIERIARSR